MCGQSPAQREQNLARMEALLQETGFPYYLASLEQVGTCWKPEGTQNGDNEGGTCPLPPNAPHLCPQALELPGSVLRRGAGAAGEPCPSYKEAVEGFIQQQRQEAADGDGDTSSVGSSTQHGPGGHPAAPRLPPATLTAELLRLFEAAETLTAKEELLQMLR